MKRSCKNINITDWKVIYPWVQECVHRHCKRYDFKRLLCRLGGMEPEEYQYVIATDKKLMEGAVEIIAKEAARRIVDRKLDLPPCHIREKQDHSTLKWRLIGKESAMQQIFDYIAVRSCEDIWRRRIVPQQSSSIKRRGQVYGTVMISKWIQADNRAADYARQRGMKYSRKCKYYVKLDIRKCYQSMRVDRFMRLFRRDCANKDILWLWETLLKSHRVPLPDGTINEGFMIGALPSQMAAQYVLSFIYRYATGLHYMRRGKAYARISHMELFMDDMLLFGSSRKNLKIAARQIIAYARDEFALEIKPDWQICDIDDSPVDMMGFVIHPDGNVTIRPRVFIKARRMALRIIRQRGMALKQAKRISSYMGYFRQKKPRWRKKLKLCAKRIYRKLHLAEIFRKASGIISKHERMMKNAGGIQCAAR